MAFGKPSLKGRALRLLAGREYSRTELERRLRQHEEQPGELAAALDELTAKGFISEARVVHSVVQRRAARLGAARIRQELQAKGVAPEAVAAAVQGLQSSELARAQDVWRRKFDTPPRDAQERGKQMRFLVARGFGGETVRKVLAGRGDEDDGGGRYADAGD
ncbi:recombination regulator RecX [Xylophilus ampelinus]|nr:recombination regulator RecX [Xylophilus ampelinus]MCS4511552.1 recombination regulator RecX [Xylophilus ampelinus]